MENQLTESIVSRLKEDPGVRGSEDVEVSIRKLAEQKYKIDYEFEKNFASGIMSLDTQERQKEAILSACQENGEVPEDIEYLGNGIYRIEGVEL